ncbi:MAG: hypothetical protein KJ574_05215 [Nanoarchaeota archaeon]|nr:hypothetical protein [Nanoarchaeota archaeon]
MGGSTNIQQLARLLTKLALLVREKETVFARKHDCVKALSELKYQAEQGRHEYWHSTPKIIEVLSSLVGTTQETQMVEGDTQSISELRTTWDMSKSNIAKKQLPLLAFILKYVRFIPPSIEKHSGRLNDTELDRGVKIRRATSIVQNIEQVVTRTNEVLYLYYLVQVFDTEEGKNALSLLIKKMKQKHPVGVRAELEALQRTLDVPAAIISGNNYVEIINRVYDTAQRSRDMHDKTINELLELRHWLIFKLVPLLEKNYSILVEQSRTIEEMRRVWLSDYSERDILENIKKLSALIEEENESNERLREEMSYYMRTKQVLRDVVCFTKSSQQQLMSHHATLFEVAVLSYNIFPLLSAFYSVDEFSNYWDVAEDFVLPPSSIRKTISSIGLRVFAGIF